jgi:hypothetical protein
VELLVSGDDSVALDCSGYDLLLRVPFAGVIENVRDHKGPILHSALHRHHVLLRYRRVYAFDCMLYGTDGNTPRTAVRERGRACVRVLAAESAGFIKCISVRVFT